MSKYPLPSAQLTIAEAHGPSGHLLYASTSNSPRCPVHSKPKASLELTTSKVGDSFCLSYHPSLMVFLFLTLVPFDPLPPRSKRDCYSMQIWWCHSEWLPVVLSIKLKTFMHLSSAVNTTVQCTDPCLQDLGIHPPLAGEGSQRSLPRNQPQPGVIIF